MKWRASQYVPMVLYAGLCMWSLAWVIANALWWHSVEKGTCAGFVLGLSVATLMYRWIIWHYKRSVEFWKRGHAEALGIADGWRELLREHNPQAWAEAMRVFEGRTAARKRMN